MKWSNYAGLETIEVEAPENSDAIVVLHGYGADAKDLAPLAGEMALQPPKHWYFLNAPLKLDGPVMMEGRMWFAIDMMGLQTALAKGGFREFFSSEKPAGLDEAVAKVSSFMDEIKTKHPHIALGGFSQGAMVASQVALKKVSSIDKLLLFSSTFINEDFWTESFKDKKPLFKVFQSHGTHDPVLPVGEARRLAKFLEEQGLGIEYYEFPGGHEIPYEVLTKATEFLS